MKIDRKKVFPSIWIMIYSLLVLSCQKFNAIDAELSDPEKIKIQVLPRSNSSESLIYPIEVYVFDMEGNQCVSQRIESPDDDLNLNLSLGAYKIISLAGRTNDYQFPDNPQITNSVAFTNGDYANSPIMFGKAELSIDEAGDSKSLEITLEHKVAALNIELAGIPKNVDKVDVRLSPLYSSFSLNGDFHTSGGIAEVSTQKNDKGLWCASSVYIFQGSAQETKCEIVMTSGDKVETHTYVYKGVPKANHPFNLKGNYKGKIVQGGSFIIKGWQEAIDVEFEFGSEPDSEGSGGDIDLKDIPEAGSVWNGCVVLSVDTVKGADLFLMSLDEWEATSVEAIDIPKGYSVNGIDNWRFPTDEEAKLMRDRYNDDRLEMLNEKILADSPDNWEISAYSNSRYLCLKGSEFYSFQFIAGKSVTKAGVKKPYLVRLVKNYSYVP